MVQPLLCEIYVLSHIPSFSYAWRKSITRQFDITPQTIGDQVNKFITFSRFFSRSLYAYVHVSKVNKCYNSKMKHEGWQLDHKPEKIFKHDLLTQTKKKGYKQAIIK